MCLFDVRRVDSVLVAVVKARVAAGRRSCGRSFG
jgi:hypothetical protein